jgi:hypothetical protein
MDRFDLNGRTALVTGRQPGDRPGRRCQLHDRCIAAGRWGLASLSRTNLRFLPWQPGGRALDECADGREQLLLIRVVVAAAAVPREVVAHDRRHRVAGQRFEPAEPFGRRAGRLLVRLAQRLRQVDS